jgi:chemotaxis protein methyltransferase CheR
MDIVNARDFDEYLEYIDCHPEGKEELRKLIASITVNETNFFRHPDQFKALKEQVIPEIIDRKVSRGASAEPIASLWSAGCSTGDETYTIALQVRDVVEPFYANNMEILGTDIDENVLDHARSGFYKMRTLQYVSDRLRDSYFKDAAGGFKLNDLVRHMVEFKYHNLVETPYPRARWGKWDVIFCRNVIIYFDKATVKRVISNLYRSLAEGGYLFLGYSESLNGITDKLTLCRFGDVFAYRKEATTVHKPAPKPVEPEVSQCACRATVCRKTQDEIRNLLEAEQYDKAIKKATALVKKSPNDAVSLSLAARAHLEKGHHEDAADAAVHAIELDPLQTHAYFIMGVVCEEQEDHNLAIRYLRRALYLDDTLAMAYVHLAMLYQKTGKRDDALREYKNAIRLLKKMTPDSKAEFTGGVNVRSILAMCKKNISRGKNTASSKTSR